MGRRHPVPVGLVVAGLVLNACGATQVSPLPAPVSSDSAAPSGTSTAVPASVGPAPSGGPPTQSSEITDADVAPDPSPPLPEAALTDPIIIGDALYDPAGVGFGVVSALALMGVSIIGSDGIVIRPATGTPATDLTLTEDEVRGLIAMGTADARAIIPGMPGGSPYTFADLHAALSPLLGGMSADDLAARYASAYGEHPDSLLGGIIGAPIEPDRALTRVHLWLLFVDGFLHGAEGASRDGTPRVVLARASAPGWGTADPNLPDLVSPDPRLSHVGFALMLAHLPMLAFAVPFEAEPLAGSAHEGHGGQGKTVPITAKVGVPAVTGLLDPVTGAPLFVPASPLPDGIPVRWATHDRSVLDDHGSLDRLLDVPILTDVLGDAAIRYSPRQEDADGRGDEVTDVANLEASVGIRDLVTHFYDVSPIGRGFLFGDRTAPAILAIGWHEEAGLEIDLTNFHNVKVEPFIQSFLPTFNGVAQRAGVDTTSGFLARQADGTYSGTLRAKINLSAVHMAFATKKCDFDAGTGFVASSGQWLSVIGRPSTTTAWSTYDPSIWRRVTSGRADSEVVQLSFYPAGPAKAWAVWCLPPVGYDDPQLGPQGTYAPFNDLAWTNPTIGYPIFTPSSGELRYQDARGTLNPTPFFVQGDIEGSIWSVIVTRKGNAP